MTSFNQLTPAEAERLAILAEECGEVVQIVGKILRHGYESCHPNDSITNGELLEKELGDLLCIMEIMIECYDLLNHHIEGHKRQKRKNLQKYLHHQKELL